MSRRDDEHADYPMNGPRRRRGGDPDDLLDTPVDLAAVQADDALLDMLGGAGPGLGGADAELAQVLVAWRRDVETEPVGELVDTDTATAVIGAARRPAPRRHPVLAPFAVAAAVLVIAFSGVGLAAKSAQPGDQLWSLTKVLYSEYARSVETANQVEDELGKVETALKKGEVTPAEAKKSLDQIKEQLEVVDEREGKTELATRRDKLEKELAGLPGTPADPEVTTEPSAGAPEPSAAAVQPEPSTPAPSPTTSEVPPTKPSEEPPPPSPSPTAPATPTSTEPGPAEGTPRSAPETPGTTVPSPTSG
jgi:hypothetical protein